MLKDGLPAGLIPMSMAPSSRHWQRATEAATLKQLLGLGLRVWGVGVLGCRDLGVILLLYWDNGKENGNCYYTGLYRV